MTADKRLAAALRAVAVALAEIRVPSMIIGGVAVIAAGFVRTTRDVDAVVRGRDSDIESILATFERYGIVLSDRRARAAIVEKQLMLLRHIATEIDVDVSFGWFPFEEEALARAVAEEVHGVVVRVATPEDLIIYKGTAWRLQDQYDVEQLLLLRLEDIDVPRVRALLVEICAVLEAPERITEFDKLVEQARRARLS